MHGDTRPKAHTERPRASSPSHGSSMHGRLPGRPTSARRARERSDSSGAHPAARGKRGSSPVRSRGLSPKSGGGAAATGTSLHNRGAAGSPKPDSELRAAMPLPATGHALVLEPMRIMNATRHAAASPPLPRMPSMPSQSRLIGSPRNLAELTPPNHPASIAANALDAARGTHGLQLAGVRAKPLAHEFGDLTL
jgi:hypothetical protein